MFSNLTSPPPSFGSGGAGGGGISLDDLILRRRAPEDGTASGSGGGGIFSPRPASPKSAKKTGERGPGRPKKRSGGATDNGSEPASYPTRGRGRPRRNTAAVEEEEDLGAADGGVCEDEDEEDKSPLDKLVEAAAVRAAVTPSPSRPNAGESSEEEEETAAAASKIERGARLAEAAKAAREAKAAAKAKAAAARAKAAAARAKKRPLIESDSDDDGNKVGNVRAGIFKTPGRGRKTELERLLKSAATIRQRTILVDAEAPDSAPGSMPHASSSTPGSRSLRERRAPRAYWLNEGVSSKVSESWRPALDPFNANPLSPVMRVRTVAQAAVANLKKPLALEKPPATRGRGAGAKKKAQRAKRGANDEESEEDDDVDEDSAESEETATDGGSEDTETDDDVAAIAPAQQPRAKTPKRLTAPTQQPRAKTPKVLGGPRQGTADAPGTPASEKRRRAQKDIAARLTAAIIGKAPPTPPERKRRRKEGDDEVDGTSEGTKYAWVEKLGEKTGAGGKGTKAKSDADPPQPKKRGGARIGAGRKKRVRPDGNEGETASAAEEGKKKKAKSAAPAHSSAAAAEPKRRPGRPPSQATLEKRRLEAEKAAAAVASQKPTAKVSTLKAAEAGKAAEAAAAAVAVGHAPAPARRRGRPAAARTMEAEKEVPKRGRGRPAKKTEENGTFQVKTSKVTDTDTAAAGGGEENAGPEATAAQSETPKTAKGSMKNRRVLITAAEESEEELEEEAPEEAIDKGAAAFLRRRDEFLQAAGGVAAPAISAGTAGDLSALVGGGDTESAGGLAMMPPTFTAAAATAAPSAEDLLGGWTSDQLQQLQRAQHAVDPGVRNFWKEVAKLVPGKNADECYARVYEEDDNPPAARAVAGATGIGHGALGEGAKGAGKGGGVAGAKATKGQAGARQRMRDRRWEQRKEELMTYEDDAFAVFEFGGVTPKGTPTKAPPDGSASELAKGGAADGVAGGGSAAASVISPTRASARLLRAGAAEAVADLQARQTEQQKRDGYVERWLKKRGGQATARRGPAKGEVTAAAHAGAGSRQVREEISRLAASSSAPVARHPDDTDDEDGSDFYFSEDEK